MSDILAERSSRRLRTLIVDDSLMNRRILDRVLRFHFADMIALDSISHASDGYEALAQLEKEEKDLVLLDIDMPKLGGVEVAKRRRVLHGDRNTLIVACTTSNSPEQQLEYARVGMDGCVGKPLNLPDLRAAIHKAMDDRWSGQSEAHMSIAPDAADDKLVSALHKFSMQDAAGTTGVYQYAEIHNRLLWMDLGGLSSVLTSPRLGESSTASTSSLPTSRCDDNRPCYFSTDRRASIAISPLAHMERHRHDSISTDISEGDGDLISPAAASSASLVDMDKSDSASSSETVTGQ